MGYSNYFKLHDTILNNGEVFNPYVHKRFLAYQTLTDKSFSIFKKDNKRKFLRALSWLNSDSELRDYVLQELREDELRRYFYCYSGNDLDICLENPNTMFGEMLAYANKRKLKRRNLDWFPLYKKISFFYTVKYVLAFYKRFNLDKSVVDEATALVKETNNYVGAYFLLTDAMDLVIEKAFPQIH